MAILVRTLTRTDILQEAQHSKPTETTLENLEFEYVNDEYVARIKTKAAKHELLLWWKSYFVRAAGTFSYSDMAKQSLIFSQISNRIRCRSDNQTYIRRAQPIFLTCPMT